MRILTPIDKGECKEKRIICNQCESELAYVEKDIYTYLGNWNRIGVESSIRIGYKLIKKGVSAMAYKDKQQMYNYNNEFTRDNYDRFSLLLPKYTKAKLKEVASKHNESVNAYINEAIRQRMSQSDSELNEVKPKNKTKATLLSALLTVFLIVVLVVSFYVDIAPNVPIAIFFYPIGVGYFFGDMVKSFYKRLLGYKTNKNNEVTE